MPRFQAPKPPRHNEAESAKASLEKSNSDPDVLASAIRGDVSSLVSQSSFPNQLTVDSAQIGTADIAKDVEEYRTQMEELSLSGNPAHAVDLEYRSHSMATGRGRIITVLLRFLPITEPISKYEGFLTSLNQSGIRPYPISQNDAHEIFVDRLSEFIATRVDSGVGSSPPSTFVETNRIGETVLYAKGYFLSTGTVFGTSTPAIASIPSGRYSFGILNSKGQQQFENAVWSIPTQSAIRLNLS
ncbi:hypothetical protein [Bradyrhizobium roseum]|uniref:hypothetical protein n=1 Tax=Bradyrhizobium roseum TaxID=3056648 RepID=UPI00261AA80B|nr:hypothetical protein [Bradyrhizobium roseus]WKA27501.1 hypothetical protein QUH67_28630 [Bradyrhizobium roseus]